MLNTKITLERVDTPWGRRDILVEVSYDPDQPLLEVVEVVIGDLRLESLGWAYNEAELLKEILDQLEDA